MNQAWLTPEGEIYKLHSVALDGRWSMDQIDRRGGGNHKWLPIIVGQEHRKDWKAINLPTRESPYSEPAIPCCSLSCGREAVYMFVPCCDGPEDGRCYHCEEHAADGLTMPQWCDLPRPWGWEVRTCEEEREAILKSRAAE